MAEVSSSPTVERGCLNIFLLGPGYGESVIIITPDGRVLVMDSCSEQAACLTKELLEQLHADQIDLFILSHPDLDHIRGIPELFERYPPHELWRYPHAPLLREYAAQWCEAHGHTELRRALEALGQQQARSGLVAEVGAEHLPWPPQEADYTVRALAPTHYDRSRAQRVFEKLLKTKAGRLRIDAWLARLAEGGRFNDSPNVISLAVSISWAGHQVLLSGDVLRGTKSPYSGWTGIMSLLRRRDQLALVTDNKIVKVAHHGSRGAWEDEAWALHAQSQRPHAVVAPFCPSKLPDATTLAKLRSNADQLHLASVDDRTRKALKEAGWVGSERPATMLPGCCVQLILQADGHVECKLGAKAMTLI